MPFCTRCGAAVPDAASFCPACGAPRAGGLSPGISPYGSAYAAPPAYAPPPGPRPVGAILEPWLVPLLVFITLGIYGFVYWWRASREVDDFLGLPGHAHGKVRVGVFLGIGAIAVALVGVILLVTAGLAADRAQAADAAGDPAADALSSSALASLGFAVMLLFLAAGLGIAAYVLVLVGSWRVWHAIRADEARRGVVNPLSPGLQLAFTLIPYLNFVTSWIALYRTQKGLNGMWQAQPLQGSP